MRFPVAFPYPFRAMHFMPCVPLLHSEVIQFRIHMQMQSKNAIAGALTGGIS